MVKSGELACVGCIALGFVAWSSAQAHHIYGHDTTAVGAGTVSSVVFSTPADGNDNVDDTVVGRSPNTLSLSKNVTDIGLPLDVRFLVEVDNEATSNVTEYAVTEQVTNDTGVAVNSILFQLGFGTGGAFLSSTHADGLDFDQEAGPLSVLDDPQPVGKVGGSPVFTVVTIPADDQFVLSSSGGEGAMLLPGQTLEIEFQLDIPSIFADGETANGLNIPEAFLHKCDPPAATCQDDPPFLGIADFTSPFVDDPFNSGYEFTLRQTLRPVPVPAAVWLLASVVGLGAAFRRFRTTT